MKTRKQIAVLVWLAWCSDTVSSFSLPLPTGGVSDHLKYGTVNTRRTCILLAKKKSDAGNSDDAEEWVSVEHTEVIQNFNEDDEEEEWVPDMEKAKRKREILESIILPISSKEKTTATSEKSQKRETVTANADDGTNNSNAPSPYTEEEEEVIRAMGGKRQQSSASGNKREPGFLGDCTLQEIATDYSVPVCYLADVLCMWGTPVPIDVHARLGDLVTGEQAFAILEAINSLDVAALNDRYSNQSLMVMCDDWDIPLNEAFEMAVKEGWSLPFGVHTVLRVEQEEQLIRVLGSLAP